MIYFYNVYGIRQLKGQCNNNWYFEDHFKKINSPIVKPEIKLEDLHIQDTINVCYEACKISVLNIHIKNSHSQSC